MSRSLMRLLVVGIALLALIGCSDEPTPTPSPYTGYLTEEIPPCTPVAGSSVDPCEPGVKVETTVFAAASSGWIFEYDKPWTIRQYLDGSAITFIPHIVVRGTYIPDTVRCTLGNPNRTPSYVEPGYFQHSIAIQCYADVRVNDYILGAGPPRLTVQVAFLHYWDGYYAPISADDISEQEAVERFRTAHVMVLENGPKLTGEGIYGREVILFIGPAHNHATEVWEVFETWDVQRREDGTAIAGHPDRDDWRGLRPDKYREHLSSLEMELPRFKKEVAAAHQARVSEYGGRTASEDIQSRAEGVALPLLISDVHDLDEFMANTGAYDHPDGTPVPPPPVPGEGDPVPHITVDDSTPVSPTPRPTPVPPTPTPVPPTPTPVPPPVGPPPGDPPEPTDTPTPMPDPTDTPTPTPTPCPDDVDHGGDSYSRHCHNPPTPTPQTATN